MLKKTITYTNYNGEEFTEDFYFNINKAELTEMEMGIDGGLSGLLQKAIAAKDAPTLMKTFKDIIMRAYGEKSLDGKRFIKSEELSIAFTQTEAYNVLFDELFSDADKAAKFVEAVIPEAPKDPIPAPPAN